MLLEEFENVPAVIESTNRNIRGGGEICDTLSGKQTGEALECLRMNRSVADWNCCVWFIFIVQQGFCWIL